MTRDQFLVCSWTYVATLYGVNRLIVEGQIHFGEVHELDVEVVAGRRDVVEPSSDRETCPPGTRATDDDLEKGQFRHRQ